MAMNLVTSAWESGSLVFRNRATRDVVFAIGPTGLTLPAGLTINGVAYTFPAADGSNTNQLTTDGSGVLAWLPADDGAA